MVAAGLKLPPNLLALVCASHDGRLEHLQAAREILASAGLDESALRNTKDLPLDDDAARDVVRGGGVATSLLMNCSGKHSGMLATCITCGWATDESYLNRDHELQKLITAMMPEMIGEEVANIVVDGCGAPAHAMTLAGLARGFRAVAMAKAGSPARVVSDAMRQYPQMVGGPTRDVSLLMAGISGLVAKDGAEGVYAAALPDGRAIALKIADGANRARPPLMRAALVALGVDISGVDERAFSSPIFGHGKVVGEVRVIDSLLST
jgi:L-asparaginase II